MTANPFDAPRPKPDDIHVGDIVKLSPGSVLYRVTEIEERKRQAYWGYWFRNIRVETVKSGRRRSTYTSNVRKVDGA